MREYGNHAVAEWHHLTPDQPNQTANLKMGVRIVQFILMPDHVDHLHDFICSVWRRFFLLVEFQDTAELVGKSFNNFLSKLVEEKESHH
ncbi:hypothetical protein CFP56_015363 [Quercus suber]|uniref:Uncharacterized protein n=1 Tax=Quercus suber TaxID=58331 RepID=A0AAW0KQS9_QUESU